MLNFIADNLSTILVSAMVAGVILAAALKMLHDKKKGKSSCGGNCANCPKMGTKTCD